jgi:hypothetical protein
MSPGFERLLFERLEQLQRGQDKLSEHVESIDSKVDKLTTDVAVLEAHQQNDRIRIDSIKRDADQSQSLPALPFKKPPAWLLGAIATGAAAVWTWISEFASKK